ncbi:hypothetical protein [Aquimarina litoralis]|uniref:hypothetical protein n=1 Tax=Aquimarina litoralis TaxID=584605 RepID=UPI001C59FF60|nr:hypothetical protein [Aquimarina litoralis]MBW1294746.1 hypothetical protein [Aquimarina litoralis]
MKFLKNIFQKRTKKIIPTHLFSGIGESKINEHGIWISKYPFEPSSVYPERQIDAKEIISICIEFGMARIILKDDIVFISAEKKEALTSFANRNNIPLSPYSWNWDWILEPYLDTELTEENKQQIESRLLENGFSKTEIETIRKEVGKQMFHYNFSTMLWEWCSLSLPDVLSTMKALYTKEKFRDFYRRALEIERRNI